MGVVIKWSGISEVISNLTSIETKAKGNIEKQMGELGKDAKGVLQQATPERTGHLRSGAELQVNGMSFTLANDIKYFPFVDEGHMTPSHFRGRPAKRRSHVAGKNMSEKAVQFIEDNIEGRISKFLD